MGADAAQATTTPPTSAPAAAVPPIDVIEVKGRIDTVVENFLEQSLEETQRADSQLLIVQLDSPGSILDDDDFDRLLTRIRTSAVPVAVWVGPSGARVSGESVRFLRAAAAAGIDNGAHVGPSKVRCPECRPNDPLVGGQSLSGREAGRQLAVDLVTPTLGDFIVGLDGREIGGRELHTAQQVTRNDQPRREPIAQVRFAKLDLVGRVLHATTTPWIAYLLFLLGLLLIVFEFYSVGIGLAGLTGAGSMALSAYGLGALGATPLGLFFIGLAVFGFSVDVQAGAPRAWTMIGTVCLLLGSWSLFPGDRRLSWLAILLMVTGTVLFAVRGMASMVRARFSTATIGRESMIGERAEATTDLDPDGMVRLRGALWRARVNRATPIRPGEAVKVVAIDGLVLEVESEDRPLRSH